mgnify:CR=1 FL=1
MSLLLEQGRSRLEADDRQLLVTGVVSFAEASAMAEAGRVWLADQPADSEVAFDLRGVGRVSSAALSVLLEWTRQARDAGVNVSAVYLSAPLERLTRVAELDTLLPLAESDVA